MRGRERCRWGRRTVKLHAACVCRYGYGKQGTATTTAAQHCSIECAVLAAHGAELEGRGVCRRQVNSATAPTARHGRAGKGPVLEHCRPLGEFSGSRFPCSRSPEPEKETIWIQYGPSIWWYWACSVVAQFGQVYAELCFGSDNEFCFRPSFPLHHKRARKETSRRKRKSSLKKLLLLQVCSCPIFIFHHVQQLRV